MERRVWEVRGKVRGKNKGVKNGGEKEGDGWYFGCTWTGKIHRVEKSRVEVYLVLVSTLKFINCWLVLPTVDTTTSLKDSYGRYHDFTEPPGDSVFRTGETEDLTLLRVS